MSYRIGLLLASGILLGWFILNAFNAADNSPMTDFYSLKAKSLEGKTIDFATFRGKMVLLVNTATECGYAPQLKTLEKLQEIYGDRLVVVGMPTNDFAGQEPRDGQEIAAFCERNYGVSFLMLEKSSTKGAAKGSVFKWLTEKKQNGRKSSRIWWNFQKYLVNEKGELVDYYFTFTQPDAPKIIKQLEK